MKKIINTTTLMFIAALALTSCHGNHAQQGLEQEERQVEHPVTVTYSIKCSQDAVDAINMVVDYMDNGISATDTIRDTIWTKTVVNDSIPAKVGLHWAFTPKGADKIGKDTIGRLEAYYTIQCTEPDTTLWNCIFQYRGFPTSKLGTLCEVVNHRQTDPRLKWYGYPPCFSIRSRTTDNSLYFGPWEGWKDQ